MRGTSPARLILVTGLLAGLVLPALAVAAPAGASVAAGRGPAVAITSTSSPFASGGQKLTVQGTFTNRTRSTLMGVSVQLASSGTPFTAPSQLQPYAAGQDPTLVVSEPRAADKLRGTIAPGVTVHWKAVLPVNEVGMSLFGVYPLAAQASDGLGTTLGASYSFLPFWPSAKSKLRPRRDDIAWIWPLIDTPDQGPCPGLLNNRLAASLARGGRLDSLLAAGTSSAGQAAKLTWAIDPALLSSASIMGGGPGKKPYLVGPKHGCQGARSYPASAAARSWLTRLSAAVRSQPAFVTPYADADIAALVRANLEDDLHRAFMQGRSVARQILGPEVVPGSGQSSPISSAAWPVNGIANYAMLENLAATDGIKTVVLSSSAMPPQQTLPYTPSAVTHTPNGVGGQTRVLLADSTLSQILGNASSASSAAAQFSVKQLFLAQTAMIASQAPNLSRAIVVTPPRRWNPPAGLASALLRETSQAPWLTPTSAGSLAAQRHASGQAPRQQPVTQGRNRFSPPLTAAIRAANRGVALAEGLRVTSSPQLSWAMAGVESSAWRDTRRGRRPARAILRRVNLYVAQQEAGVSLFGEEHTTLGGQKGSVPVTIDNRLGYAVRVRIKLVINQRAHSGQFTLLSGSGVRMISSNVAVTKPIVVQRHVPATTKLQVKATGVGTTDIEMYLLTARGQPLPGQKVTTSVKTTHFGTFALVILAAALGIFMITSAGRAVRRGRTPATDGEGSDEQPEQSPERPEPDSPGPPGPGGPDGAGQEAQASDDAPARSGARGSEQPEEADNVSHDRARSDAAGTDQLLTEDADDYVRVPGWAYRG